MLPVPQEMPSQGSPKTPDSWCLAASWSTAQKHHRLPPLGRDKESKNNPARRDTGSPGDWSKAQVCLEHSQQQEARLEKEYQWGTNKGPVGDKVGGPCAQGGPAHSLGAAIGAENGAILPKQAAAAAHSLMPNNTEKSKDLLSKTPAHYQRKLEH